MNKYQYNLNFKINHFYKHSFFKGCNHMTCTCKNQFCYVCGVNYISQGLSMMKACECS